MGGSRELISHSDLETQFIGTELGKSLLPNDILCFIGTLGAGKTTFIKGVVQGIGTYSPDLVNSPTYVYLNIYEGSKTVYHFDLYRLPNSEAFISMGFDDWFFAGGICCVEWSERILDILPEKIIRVEMTHGENGTRHIHIH